MVQTLVKQYTATVAFFPFWQTASNEYSLVSHMLALKKIGDLENNNSLFSYLIIVSISRYLPLLWRPAIV